MEEALRADLVEPTIEYERVAWDSRCEKCDEDRVDFLYWEEDFTHVTCATCGHRYELS